MKKAIGNNNIYVQMELEAALKLLFTTKLQMQEIRDKLEKENITDQNLDNAISKLHTGFKNLESALEDFNFSMRCLKP